MSCLPPFLVGVISSFTASALWALLLWVNRNRIANALAQRIDWKRSGDAWWLACDLHTIKLQAKDGRVAKMRDAMNKALGHAERMSMNDEVISQIRKLTATHGAKQELTDVDKEQIRERVDAILDECGKLAGVNQPGYAP